MPSDYHSFRTCPAASHCGIMVPQEVFAPYRPFEAKSTITFSTNGHCGIKLKDILGAGASIDHGTSVPNLWEKAKKVTLRINWPGYEPWHQIIHIFQPTHDHNPITLKALAYEVAKGVLVLIKDYSSVPCTQQSWAFRQSTLENITLVELRHVSHGSWQPILCLPPGYIVHTTAVGSRDTGSLIRRSGHPLSSLDDSSNETVESLDEVFSSLPQDARVTQPRRLRWLDIIFVVTTLMGIWKFVATHQGQSYIPNLLDLMVGTVATVGFTFLSLYGDLLGLRFLSENEPWNDLKYLFVWSWNTMRARHTTSEDIAIKDMERGAISVPPMCHLADRAPRMYSDNSRSRGLTPDQFTHLAIPQEFNPPVISLNHPPALRRPSPAHLLTT